MTVPAALIVNVVGALIMLAGLIALTASAFAVDPRAGWALIGVALIVVARPLARYGPTGRD